jgi:UDP-N-acetylglucosamine:LPS N-acetylglucosamine transferase
MVPESELGSGRLWTEVMKLASSAEERAGVAARALERGKPHAADQIVAELARLVRNKG